MTRKLYQVSMVLVVWRVAQVLIDIDKIVVGDRIRKDFGDIQELAEDIKENTLLNALVVTPSGEGTYLLIAGERRLRACKLLGYKAVPVNTVGVEDAERALMMEISENECRKEFTKTERLEYARKLARIESAKSEQGKRSDLAQNVVRSERNRSANAVAQTLGTNRETLRQEQFIADNADLLDPADFADWDEGRLSTNKAFQRIKAAQRQAEHDRIIAEKERDAARDELADAYRASELMEAQVASLKRQVAEKPKPEVIEREVIKEVVPSDYETTKRKAADLKRDNDRLNREYREMQRKKQESDRKLAQANEILGEKSRTDNAQRDIEQFTASINAFIRQYAGRALAFDQFSRVDGTTQSEFKAAVANMFGFSQNLMQMIENNQ